MTDPGTKLTVIKDYEVGKSVMGIACQPGMSHVIRTMIWKTRNKGMEDVKGPASLKSMRLAKFKEHLYQTHRNF